MNIEVNQANLEKIQKYIEEGRYKSVDEFVKRAIESLLYAEDRKEERPWSDASSIQASQGQDEV